LQIRRACVHRPRSFGTAAEPARRRRTGGRLYLLYGYAHELLAQRGINVRRNYVGNYCTSLDMAGTSITLSRLDDEIAGLLAAPAEIAIRTF